MPGTANQFMTIKEEETEYTPVASLVQQQQDEDNEDHYIDSNDPQKNERNVNNKKKINMIPPREEIVEKENQKVFTRKMVKLNRNFEAEKIEKLFQEEKVKSIDKEAKFIQNFSKEMPHRWVQAKIFDNNNILIKPKVDASNKQIFTYNEFRTMGDGFLQMIEGSEKQDFLDNIFCPEKFGNFSHPQQATQVMRSEFMRDEMIDFQTEYIINPKKALENKIKLRDSNENLPPRPLAKGKPETKLPGIQILKDKLAKEKAKQKQIMRGKAAILKNND